MSEEVIDYNPDLPRRKTLGIKSPSEYSNEASEQEELNSSAESETEEFANEASDMITPLQGYATSLNRVDFHDSNTTPLVCLLRKDCQISKTNESSAELINSEPNQTGLMSEPQGYLHRRPSNISVTQFLASDSVREALSAQRHSITFCTTKNSNASRRLSEPIELLYRDHRSFITHSAQTTEIADNPDISVKPLLDSSFLKSHSIESDVL